LACTNISGSVGNCQDNRVTVPQCAPPTASPTQSPSANSAGWNNTGVTVNWNFAAASTGYPIDASKCPTSSSTSLGDQGSITLSATCFDTIGTSTTAHYTVKIDTLAPTISVPSLPVTVDATSPAGATVNYTSSVSFNDSLSGVDTTASGCAPASGSLFGIGTTTVNCSAFDLAGNQATASFTVNVLGPADQAAILLGQVTAIGQSGLIKSAQQIQADIAKNHVNAACSDLADFVGLVKAQTGKSVTTAQANTLTGEATDLTKVLGC
jgi:hypothetical protein